MADDPSFDSVKVPDRTEATAKAIDNAVQQDDLGADVLRQVTVAGDPVDHDLVGRVIDAPTDPEPAGPVVWPAGAHGEAGRVEARAGDEDTRALLGKIAEDISAIRTMFALLIDGA
jgi:hypothetical protein